jgi:hypothetical protein|tara:strand:- start:1920 stop:2213 length:294 start_codon:yes stop_codon:yes gene_type:complete
MGKISVYFRIQEEGNLKFDRIMSCSEIKKPIPEDLENMLKSGADVIKFEESNGEDTIYKKIEDIAFINHPAVIDNALLLHPPPGKKVPYRVITYKSK